ncbi:MAG: HEAT repeat domain-containing protein [Planctomycetes bacterium]|nr:HEAT repeat domain-containing protein [Planctomycetota bacterium]
MKYDLSSSIRDLTDAEAVRRAAAAESLARLGPNARAAAVPLVRAAGDADEAVREWAVAALEELGPPERADAKSLAELLASTEGSAYWAATLLGRLRAEAAEAVPALAAALAADRPLSVRQRAAWALGQIGTAAVAALDALRTAAAADEPRLARLAGIALEQIEPRAQTP